ncbi:class I SAM-dependent methyltransferase [Micromonospora sp. NBC_00898]|uniref:class I SAM-dependent methyltransferase n=1 Tax=Micromonospora sp. NBC_00898 TaxID=2975981 RepID=UPI00386BE214|nr:class I SAM-dependent methyltransferase [Micromonospora sp. NBC_00898]
MNTDHDLFCASAEWAEHLAAEVIPWGLADLDLNGHTLELGGGFGASSAYLLDRCDRLTVLEADPKLAAALAARFPGIDVLHADATAIPLPDASVDAVVCFTMLHHVSPQLAQDQLFSEAARVLRPAGWFAGTDSLASDNLRGFHADDIYEPVDPATLPARLRAAGFVETRADLGDRKFRFRARRRTRGTVLTGQIRTEVSRHQG